MSPRLRFKLKMGFQNRITRPDPNKMAPFGAKVGRTGKWGSGKAQRLEGGTVGSGGIDDETPVEADPASREGVAKPMG
jgi:hypothetical protein